MGIDASSSDYISSDNRYRTGGQFFPFGVKSLMDSSFETNLGLHMMKCRHVPEDIRNALEELHRLADEHGVSTKRGSKKICMEIIWDRLSNFYPPAPQADTTGVISEERVDDDNYESMKQDILPNHDSAPQADTTVATSEERRDDYSESMKQDILSNHDPVPQADTTVATSEERRDDNYESMKQDILSNHDPAPRADTTATATVTVATSEERRDDYSENKIRQQKLKQRHQITSCFPTEAGVKRQREKRQREMVDNRCCKVQTKIAAAL